jgi:hypothetical protein
MIEMTNVNDRPVTESAETIGEFEGSAAGAPARFVA